MSNPFIARLKKNLDPTDEPVKQPFDIDTTKGLVFDGKLKADGEPADDTYRDVKPKFKPNNYGIVTKSDDGETRIKYEYPINNLDISGDTSVIDNIPDSLVGKKVKNPLQQVWKMIDGDRDVNRIKFYDYMDDKNPGFNKTTLEDADSFFSKHNWFGVKNIVNGLDTYGEISRALVSMGYHKMLDPGERKKFEAAYLLHAQRNIGMGHISFNPVGPLKDIDNAIPVTGTQDSQILPDWANTNPESVKLVSSLFKAIANGDFKKLQNAEKLYFVPLRDNFQKRPIAEQMFIGFWSDPILGKTIGWGYRVAKPWFKPVSNLVKKARGRKVLNITPELKSTAVKYVDTEKTLIKVFGQDRVINNTLHDDLIADFVRADPVKNGIPGHTYIKVKELLATKKELVKKLDELAKKQKKSIEDTYEYVNDVFHKKTLADDTKAFEEIKELNIVDPVPFFESRVNALKNLDPNTIRGRANIAEASIKKAAEVIEEGFKKRLTKTGLDIISGDTAWYKQPFRKIWWEYKASDQKAVINRVTKIAAEQYKKLYGKDLPDYMNSEYLAALAPGRSSAALHIASEVIRDIRKIIGKNIPIDELNNYLKLQHASAIYRMYPDRAALAGYKSIDEVTRALAELKSEFQAIGGWEQIQEAGKVVTDFHKNILKKKLDSGMISQEWFDELTKRYPDYNPTVYINKITGETKEQLGYFATWQGGVTKNGIHKFSDAGSELMTENPLDLIKQASLFAELNISRNNLAKSWIKNLENSNIFKAGEIVEVTPRRKGQVEKLFESLVDIGKESHIQFWDNGNIRTFRVPESIAKTFKLGMDTGSSRSQVRVFRQTNAAAKTIITGLNPAFWAINLVFDTLTVMVKEGVTPPGLVIALFQAIKGATKGHTAYSKFVKSGADVYGYFGRTPEQITKEIMNDGNIVIRNAKDWAKYLSPIKVKKGKISSPLIETINEVGHTLETMPRLAVFNKRLAKGQSEILAGVAARRATVDFARTGSAVKLINQLVIYFNAGVQGTMLPYRTLVTGDGVRLSRSAAAGRIGTYTMLHGALAAYNMLHYPDEWNSLPDYMKYGAAFGITGQKGKNAVGKEKNKMIAFIPDNREFSQFTAPIVFLLEQMLEEDATSFKEFVKFYFLEATPLSRFTGETGTPTPFVADRVIQYAMNRDYFRDKDIVPPDKINLPKEDQFDEYTSEWAVDLGKATGQSPMRLEWALDVGILEEAILPLHALYKVVTGKQEIIDPLIEQYVADLLLLSELPNTKDEVRLALNRIKVEHGESVANKVRAKLLLDEREDIPLYSKIKRKFVKHIIVDSNVYSTGAKIAERETGYSNKAIQAFLNASASNSLQAKSQIKDAGDKLKRGLIDAEVYTNIVSDAYVGPKFALNVLYKNYPELKELQEGDSGQLLNDWFEKANTFGGLVKPDRRTTSQLLVDQYYSLPVIYISTTDRIDFGLTTELKDEFINTLSAERKKILFKELTSKMDPVAEQKFKDQNEYLKDFYATVKNYIKEEDPSLLPAYKKYQDTKRFNEEKAILILEILPVQLQIRDYS